MCCNRKSPKKAHSGFFFFFLLASLFGCCCSQRRADKGFAVGRSAWEHNIKKGVGRRQHHPAVSLRFLQRFSRRVHLRQLQRHGRHDGALLRVQRPAPPRNRLELAVTPLEHGSLARFEVFFQHCQQDKHKYERRGKEEEEDTTNCWRRGALWARSRWGLRG